MTKLAFSKVTFKSYSNGTRRLGYYSSPPTVPSFKAASRCWISTPASCISASVCFQGRGSLANIISFPRQLSLDRVIIWQVWIGSLILINGSMVLRVLVASCSRNWWTSLRGRFLCHCKQQSKLGFHESFALLYFCTVRSEESAASLATNNRLAWVCFIVSGFFDHLNNYVMLYSWPLSVKKGVKVRR